MQFVFDTLNEESKSVFESMHLHIQYITPTLLWVLHRILINSCVELSLRESVSDGPYQKTEEGAKEDGQKEQSQPATQEQERHGNFFDFT